MGLSPSRLIRSVGLLMLLLGVAGISVPGCSYADNPGSWTFTMQPYLWMPVIEADLKFSTPSGSPEVAINPDDYLENLDLALIVTAQAR